MDTGKDKKIVVVVDGPAGAGKSTVCRLLAEKTGYCCLDTGGLYRTVAWRARARGVTFDDEKQLVELCRDIDMIVEKKTGKIRMYADGEEMEGQIRTEETGMGASLVSRHPLVREALLPLQREVGREGGIIAEGRDMGTVVFPDAEVKIFLDAEISERANRRFRELAGRGENPDYEEIFRDISLRDDQDRNRTAAPLKPSFDSVLVDTTPLSVDEVVDVLQNIVRSRQGGGR